MTTREHLCELGCGRPAPTTTICSECEDHPRQAVNQFEDGEIDRLMAIARGQEHSKEVTARKTHDKSSIPPVANLPLLDLAHDIGWKYPEIVDDNFASRPDAVDWYYKIIGDCEKAQAMINGQTFTWDKGHEYAAHKELSDPKTYDELVDWFWDRLRIRITHDRLYQWKRRGKIRPVDDTPTPTFRPRNVLEAMQ
jgi:hypothetical protein